MTKIEEMARAINALRSVVKHWNEFGPEHGFDESIDQAERVLAALDSIIEAEWIESLQPENTASR